MKPIKLIVAGHGVTTAGKRNKYGYTEWEFTRRICAEWCKLLDAKGEKYHYLNPGPVDIPLGNLRKTADYYHKLYKGNVVLINVHSNASGKSGDWQDANGVTAFWYSENGRRVLNGFCYTFAKAMGLYNRGAKQGRFWSTLRKKFYYLYMLKRPKAVSVLLELYFHTNKSDIEKCSDPAKCAAACDSHTWEW
jgi:N-acetylmuramoyl-L-alanine amidase